MNGKTNTLRRLAPVALCLLLAFALAGCGSAVEDEAPSSTDPGGGSTGENMGGTTSGGSSGTSGGAKGSTSGGSGSGGSGGTTGGTSSGGTTGGSSSGGGTSGDESAGGSSGGTSGTSGGTTGGSSGTTGGTGGSTDPEPEAGQLTAAKWRDLSHWDFWLGLFKGGDSEAKTEQAKRWKGFEQTWQLFTRERYGAVVIANAGPVADATVELLDVQGNVVWTARTDNRGRAELFNGLFGQAAQGPFKIRASSGQAKDVAMDVQPIDKKGSRTQLMLTNASAPPARLDLMLTVDTTGSMKDELRYLQSELKDVVTRTKSKVQGQFDVRLSVNVYRDQGDQYVLRSNPFTTDISKAVSTLGVQSADGGGDFPEAVDKALADAIRSHQWSAKARARLLVLVLDAPPHNNPQIIGDLQKSLKAAASKGVRILPVAASGVDTETEFLLRSFGITTGGTYVFLTDDSGIGGSHLEPTIGDYEVEKFNDLLVELIAGYSVSPGTLD